MGVSVRSAATCSDTQEQILEAARQLIYQHGFAAMSMRTLANKVGLLPGSLYHYFSGKQDLLEEVLESVVEQRLAAWRRWERSKRERNLIRKLESFISFHVTYDLAHPHDQLLLCSERRHLDPPRQVRVRALQQVYEDYLLVLLNEGKASGLFDIKDAVCVAHSLWAMLGCVLVSPQTPCSKGQSEAWLLLAARRLLGVA